MKFNIRALALTFGLFWGGAIFLVGMVNLVAPGYGRAFLLLAASIYPGYAAGVSFEQVAIGTLYGLVDGAIGGAVFAWLYNYLSNLFQPAA